MSEPKKHIIGTDPATGGDITVITIIGEGASDGFIANSPILSYIWDLTGINLLKGGEDVSTDDPENKRPGG